MTRLEPEQIADWTQVVPLMGDGRVTQVDLEQVELDPTIVAAWRKEVAQTVPPECYRIAVPDLSTSDDHPVLITGDMRGECRQLAYPLWFRIL